MQKDLKHIIIIGTITLSIILASYIDHVRRETNPASSEFMQWLNDNQLSEFREFFVKEGIGFLDKLVHLDVEASESFRNLPKIHKERINHALHELQKESVLKTWLKSCGISDVCFGRLKSQGVNSLHKLKSLLENMIESFMKNLTEYDDYIKFTKCVTQLSNYDDKLSDLEAEMLSHHKSGLIPPNKYSISTMLLLALTVVIGAIVISVATLIMFITRVLNSGTNAESLISLSKKSLYFLSGQNDVSQHTKIMWNWEEPQTVGKTMTFNIRCFHKNGKPYPVSNKDNLTVEISHGGIEVIKTMSLGGVNPEHVNLCQVSFTVHTSGDYLIQVMFAARHIKGSPFTKKFEAGPIDASKTGFMNYTSNVVCSPDIAYPLTLVARDSFGNIAEYKPDQNNYFKIKVTECGTGAKYVPVTQIFYNSRQQQLLMQIKMERLGCFQASVSYGDVNLKNGEFNILVLNFDDLNCVEKNMNKSSNIWYKARLLECNNEKLAKPKKVYIYITPKQLKLKEYILKIIGKRLFTYRVCPSTKFTFGGINNQYGSQVFTIDDGAQGPVVLAAKDRSIIAATFTKFLLGNIGGSETFKDKQMFFYHEIRTLHQRKSSSCTMLKIDRSRLLHSSYKVAKSFDISDWCKHFEVCFLGEEGTDWGGLMREWLELVCMNLFDPNMSGLFRRLSENSQGLVHPAVCRKESEDLKLYEFAGKIVGKCLYESARVYESSRGIAAGITGGRSYRQLVKARFSRSFLAQLIGLQVHYKYFETDDPELYKSKIKYIEENDIEGMELTFSEEEYTTGLNGQGIVKVIDLIPNGSKIAVTNDNKLKYLDVLAQYRLVITVKDQIESFLKGLNELIPDNLLSIFDENELELLMCGMRKYSVADLKNNHVVTGFSMSSNRVLDWFWTIISGFNDEQMARLLQFTTGCSQLPPGGFSELVPKFQISPGYTYNTLPTAHTCFNHLCLPDYDSIEHFHRSLLIAITEGNTGFGLN